MATRAFGGAPYGATNRVRGVPKLTSMRGGDGDDEAKMDGDDGVYDDDVEGGCRMGRRKERVTRGALDSNEDPTPQGETGSRRRALFAASAPRGLEAFPGTVFSS